MFTEKEALALSKGWVRQCGKHVEQRGSEFWNDIVCRCRECGVKRTTMALKPQWSCLQRNAQKYLSSRFGVKSMYKSGGKPQEIWKKLPCLIIRGKREKGCSREVGAGAQI